MGQRGREGEDEGEEENKLHWVGVLALYLLYWDITSSMDILVCSNITSLKDRFFSY